MPIKHQERFICRSHSEFTATILLVAPVIEWTVQRVAQNVAEGKESLELLLFVDNDETMHARPADGVKDGIHAVVHRAGVDSREFLETVSNIVCGTESEGGVHYVPQIEVPALYRRCNLTSHNHHR